MVHKIFAWLMLWIFLTGSIGHSLCLHNCLHSGKIFVENTFMGSHDCDKPAEPVPVPASCCTKPEKGAENCASKAHQAIKEKADHQEKGCCEEEEVLLKVEQGLQAAGDLTLDLKYFSIAFVSLFFQPVLELSVTPITHWENHTNDPPGSPIFIQVRNLRI